jgi:MFS family permease
MDAPFKAPLLGHLPPPTTVALEDAVLADAIATSAALHIDGQQPWYDTLKGSWVLFVYCYFSMLQTMIWAIPGTVSTTLLAVYPSFITPFDVQLILAWGAFCFIACSFPVAYWLARPHGIRRCTVVGVILLTVGAACRCGAQTDSIVSLLLWHLSGVCAGLANPIAMAAPALLAETWFNAKHRGLAMALAAEANSVGGAVAFLLPPALLPANTLHDLNHVNAVCLSLCLACCACCLYFPDAPSVPPSRSAVAEGTSSQALSLATMSAAFVRLAQNPQLCLVALVYAVSVGFNSAWSGTLNLNLSQVGLSQSMAGYIGMAATLAGNVVGVFCGLYVDRFHRMKPSLVGLNVVNVLALTGFALCVQVRERGA